MPSSLGNTTIVPSDTNTMDPPCRRIFCSGPAGGTVSIVRLDASTATFTIAVGQTVDVGICVKVMATGSTAQGLLGVFF